jgi:hypothetical protein
MLSSIPHSHTSRNAEEERKGERIIINNKVIKIKEEKGMNSPY